MEGDSVSLTKDLKLKGSSTVLKRGTVVKNIKLTDDPTRSIAEYREVILCLERNF
jgi:uncharacterized Zn ribbon protein